MNWGGFAGGFAQGFNNGVAMGKTINDVMKQKKIEDMRVQGIAEAQALRSQAVDSMIQEDKPSTPAAQGVTGQPANTTASIETAKPQAMPIAEDPMTAYQPGKAPSLRTEDRPIVQKQALAEPAQTAAATISQQADKPITPQAAGLPYRVGNQAFATREEARAAAEKQAPDMMHFMTKTLVPRMQQAYIEHGDVEMADAWGKWAEDRDNKAAMKEWAGAYRAAQIGNFEKAADHVFNLYKRYDDGITPLSKETVKDKDGNITGFNVRLKNDSTGEEYSQFIDKKALTEMGLAALSPQAMFEQQFRRQSEADKMAAQAAAEIAKEQRGLQIDNYKAARDNIYQKGLKQIDNQYQTERDDRQQNNAIERMTIEKSLDAANASSKVRREVGAKVEALRGAGYSDEFINNALPAILGVGDYKKATSPEEARRLAFSDRMKSDFSYARKSPEEQKKILDQDMALIYGGTRPSATPRAQSPTTPPSRSGVPVYNPATGKIEMR